MNGRTWDDISDDDEYYDDEWEEYDLPAEISEWGEYVRKPLEEIG